VGFTLSGVRYQLTWWQVVGYAISALGLVALLTALGRALRRPRGAESLGL
jgi:hypothetical protein